MYQESELTETLAQLRRRRLLVWLPAVVLLGLAGAAVALRMGLQADTVKALHDGPTMGAIRTWEIVACAAAALAAVWLIFGLDMFCGPLKRYAVMLDGVLHGRNHTTRGAWCGVTGDLSEVEGVTCRPVGLKVTDDKGRDYERLFYWDSEKPLPSFDVGETVEIVSHGKQVVSAARAVDEIE